MGCFQLFSVILIIGWPPYWLSNVLWAVASLECNCWRPHPTRMRQYKMLFSAGLQYMWVVPLGTHFSTTAYCRLFFHFRVMKEHLDKLPILKLMVSCYDNRLYSMISLSVVIQTLKYLKSDYVLSEMSTSSFVLKVLCLLSIQLWISKQ